MRKYMITLLLFIAASAVKAQDSCYVYTQLHWAPAATKYVAKIQLNDKGTDEDITENGEKVSFNNILHALNYLSVRGWELVQLSPKNPENTPGANKEQFAVIRKLMPTDEAKKYAAPKTK